MLYQLLVKLPLKWCVYLFNTFNNDVIRADFPLGALMTDHHTIVHTAICVKAFMLCELAF